MLDALVRGWGKRGGIALLLLPVAFAFGLAAMLRRTFYRLGVLRSIRLAVPVVVIGNITVGGSGKTPLVLHLAEGLSRSGRKPGIVSRGYGGRAAVPREVSPDSSADEVGDEPLLLARRGICPVWIGRDRVEAARALLANHPECDLILCDDGLQHYRLARDVEIAVLDSRGVGNGFLLPAGPLREPVGRLREVDAVVLNGGPYSGRVDFKMTLMGRRFVALHDPTRMRDAAAFAGKNLHAVAGIGDPRRFFQHLGSLGLSFRSHPFPDHHRFTAQDLDFGPDAVILMTEKDAVKCSAFASAETWVLPVEARLEPDLNRWLLEKMNGRAPA